MLWPSGMRSIDNYKKCNNSSILLKMLSSQQKFCRIPPKFCMQVFFLQQVLDTANYCEKFCYCNFFCHFWTLKRYCLPFELSKDPSSHNFFSPIHSISRLKVCSARRHMTPQTTLKNFLGTLKNCHSSTKFSRPQSPILSFRLIYAEIGIEFVYQVGT